MFLFPLFLNTLTLLVLLSPQKSISPCQTVANYPTQEEMKEVGFVNIQDCQEMS